MNVLFPLIGAGVVFILVFGFAAFVRYLQHKETLALAEKGLIDLEKTGRKGVAVYRWGLIFVAVGFILTIALLPFSWNSFWMLLLIGQFPLLLGLSLLIIYVLIQESLSRQNPDQK
jgi:phosphoglycerol transferase MdoB-like AlkP superfamily enzyme